MIVELLKDEDTLKAGDWFETRPYIHDESKCILLHKVKKGTLKPFKKQIQQSVYRCDIKTVPIIKN